MYKRLFISGVFKRHTLQSTNLLIVDLTVECFGGVARKCDRVKQEFLYILVSLSW